jgi:hypothetical protein
MRICRPFRECIDLRKAGLFLPGLGPECLINGKSKLSYYAEISNRSGSCGAVIGLTLEAGCQGGWNA